MAGSGVTPGGSVLQAVVHPSKQETEGGLKGCWEGGRTKAEEWVRWGVGAGCGYVEALGTQSEGWGLDGVECGAPLHTYPQLTCANLCLEPVLQPGDQCGQDVHAEKNHLQGETPGTH